MAKFLYEVSYTTKGIGGLLEDSASGRRADVQAAIRALGGRVEVLYYSFGKHDVVMIAELPSAIAAAAFAMRASAAGTAEVRATPLLTVEEIDQALEVKMQYRAPGE